MQQAKRFFNARPSGGRATALSRSKPEAAAGDGGAQLAAQAASALRGPGAENLRGCQGLLPAILRGADGDPPLVALLNAALEGGLFVLVLHLRSINDRCASPKNGEGGPPVWAAWRARAAATSWLVAARQRAEYVFFQGEDGENPVEQVRRPLACPSRGVDSEGRHMLATSASYASTGWSADGRFACTCCRRCRGRVTPACQGILPSTGLGAPSRTLFKIPMLVPTYGPAGVTAVSAALVRASSGPVGARQGGR